jgi:hypothetical protein
MEFLLARLRALTNASASDYTVNNVSYFTDEQLLDELDATVQVYRAVPLIPLPQRSGTTFVYLDYTIPDYVPRSLAEQDGGEAVWAVRDGQGNPVANYTVNYRSGVITFNADTGGAGYWLDCLAYDLNRAAAVVWRQKAGMESRSVDFSNGEHSMKASQRRDYCLQQAAEFERRAGIQMSTMYRSDEL